MKSSDYSGWSPAKETKAHTEKGHVFIKAGEPMPPCRTMSVLTFDEDRNEGIWVKLEGVEA